MKQDREMTPKELQEHWRKKVFQVVHNFNQGNALGFQTEIQEAQGKGNEMYYRLVELAPRQGELLIPQETDLVIFYCEIQALYKGYQKGMLSVWDKVEGEWNIIQKALKEHEAAARAPEHPEQIPELRKAQAAYLTCGGQTLVLDDGPWTCPDCGEQQDGKTCACKNYKKPL